MNIDIVAVSTEGAALCYSTICLEATVMLGPHAHPEVSLHNFSLSAYQHLIDMDGWAAVGEMMLESAGKLVGASA
jgi:aspartate racemase